MSTNTATNTTTTTTIDVAAIAKQLNDLAVWFNANPTKEQEVKDKLKAIADSIIINNPPPPPPPDNNGGAGIGPDGVKQIYPVKQGAKAAPFYFDVNNPDKNPKIFATTYGSDIVKFNKAQTEGKITFARNVGHKQTYASGNAPGKSCRFHISAGGNLMAVGKHSWKDKPLPEFVTASDVCFYSHEMTAIVRVGKALGTHQSFAFKLNSRPDKPDDSLRSTIEMCMPNDQKADAYVNYNYAHAQYSKVPGVKQFTKDGKITVGQWIGAKLIFKIADDKKSTLISMYVNTDPIDTATGQPKNDGWKLKAEYEAKGIKEYQNIPPVWGGDSYLRIDGYDYVDVFRFSQHEIDKTANTNATTPITPATTSSAAIEVPPPADDFNTLESPNEDADTDDNPNVVKAQTLIAPPPTSPATA